MLRGRGNAVAIAIVDFRVVNLAVVLVGMLGGTAGGLSAGSDESGEGVDGVIDKGMFKISSAASSKSSRDSLASTGRSLDTEDSEEEVEAGWNDESSEKLLSPKNGNC